jgi:hypothetical protein
MGKKDEKNDERVHPAPGVSRAQLLGHIVEMGAGLEFMASQAAWVLLGTSPQEAALVTRRMSLSQLLRLIGDLAEAKLRSALLEQAKAAVKMAHAAAKRRNEFVHSYWTSETEIDGYKTHGRLKVNADTSATGQYTLDEIPGWELLEVMTQVRDASSAMGMLFAEIGVQFGLIKAVDEGTQVEDG